MKCPRCGKENEEGKAVCYFCYAPLTGPLREAHGGRAAQPTVLPRPARGGLSPTAKIVALVVFLVVAGAGTWWYLSGVLDTSGGSTPEEVVVAYVEAFFRLDIDAQCRLVTKRDRKSLEKMRGMKERLAPVFGEGLVNEVFASQKRAEVECEVQGVHRQDSRAIVDVSVYVREEGKDFGSRTAQRYVVVKERRRWKVNVARSYLEMYRATEPGER